MLDDDKMEQFIDMAKANAERSINEDLEEGNENPSFPTSVGVFYDGHTFPEVWIYPANGGDSEATLWACNAAIVGMEAEAVMTLNDSFGFKSERLKEAQQPPADADEETRKAFEDKLEATGKFRRDEHGHLQALKRDGTPWKRGDMQRAWLEQTEDAQDLTMAVMLCYYERGGDEFMAHLEYRHEDGKLVWTEDHKTVLKSTDKGPHWEGHMPESIRKMFAAPTLSEEMAKMEANPNPGAKALRRIIETAHGIDPDDGFDPFAYRREYPLEARAHQNCAVIKASLAAQGFAVAIGIGGKDEEQAKRILEIYQRSLVGGEGAPMPEGVSLDIETVYPQGRGVEDVKPKGDVL